MTNFKISSHIIGKILNLWTMVIKTFINLSWSTDMFLLWTDSVCHTKLLLQGWLLKWTIIADIWQLCRMKESPEVSCNFNIRNTPKREIMGVLKCLTHYFFSVSWGRWGASSNVAINMNHNCFQRICRQSDCNQEWNNKTVATSMLLH